LANNYHNLMKTLFPPRMFNTRLVGKNSVIYYTFLLLWNCVHTM